MAFYIPTYNPPCIFEATEEQLEAYSALNKAGLDYARAYRNTIGLFSMFSISRYKKMKETEQKYHQARERYSKSLKRRTK